MRQNIPRLVGVIAVVALIALLGCDDDDKPSKIDGELELPRPTIEVVYNLTPYKGSSDFENERPSKEVQSHSFDETVSNSVFTTMALPEEP